MSILGTHSPSKTFVGVRFVLFGIESVREHKVRSKLVDCGGVDVGHYSPNCTHVIVDRIVYDDPICVAARRDTKILVTALWVDDSFDVGMPVEASSIIYRPLKDLNGIPGAKSLIVCLTGYQRQDRDDIMTMVGLMGAQFSKPLVANKVTHLICYKFEGEKYELAKKIPRIKQVNHRWLEDCLRDWALLPEDNYNTSGYEMEMMEAEARDSEDEAENTFVKQSGVRSIYKSPSNIKAGSQATPVLPKSEGEVPKVPTFDNYVDNLSVPQNENTFNQASSFSNAYVSKSLSRQDATDVELNDQHHRTLDPKVRDDLTSNSGAAERSAHSAGKLSYSRQSPLKPTLPLYAGDKSSDRSVSSKVPSGKLTSHNNLATSSSRADQVNYKTESNCVEVPLNGTHLQNDEEPGGIVPRKRTMDLSYASSKSPKMSHDERSGIVRSPLASGKSPIPKPTSLIDGSCETTSHGIVGNEDHFLDKTGNLNAGENSSAVVSPTKSSTFIQKPLKCDPTLSATVISKTGQDGNLNKKTPLTTFQRLRKSSLSSKPGIADYVVKKSTTAVSGTVEQQNQHQGVEGSSLNKKNYVTGNSNDPANLNLLKEGNNDMVTKVHQKKVISLKTLGSRPKLTYADQKGSEYPDEDAYFNDTTINLNAGDHEKSPGAVKLDVLSPDVNTACPNEVESNGVTISADVSENNIESMDDETEAPEEESEHKLEDVLNEAKAISIQLTSNCVTESRGLQHILDHSDACVHGGAMAMGIQSTGKCVTTKESEGLQHTLDHSDAHVHGSAMTSGENTEGNDRKGAVSGKTSLLVDSTSEAGVVKGKKNEGKKRPLGKTKLKTVPAVTDVMKLKKVVREEDTRNEINGESEKEHEKLPADLAGKSKCCSAPKNKSEHFSEMKENKPVICGDQMVSKAKQQAGKSTVKSNITSLTIDQNSPKISPNSLIPEEKAPSRIKTEPVWFILCGHRFQRKDFQQVIRRLKGRCCRDSHHWSYQATHFIAPDPIRRTEKFFAAAASGRWILKSDYLAASNQEGRFLEEEPYEWYNNGLSEDGAINLEAPRKWRLLRERTGHGAFHGMRIIIYGECIAPSLDTLKRVVKAGDGIILATSPPYTRFLNLGVDFAIVSPGMPSVDMWVQEFLKHEIPCVLADYLVEYVCKPGYTLERHVLHNTHAWAEKSFGSLQSRAEEVVYNVEEDLIAMDNSGSNDIPCAVCGSGERGEVMLICGNESGSVGCGVGTHIDCCIPPLEDVPEEDWFCPKCSRSENNTDPSKKIKKNRE